MKIKGIPHITLIVENMENYEDFYTGAFCLKAPPLRGFC